DLQEPAMPPVEVETVQQGYDAELQLAVAALQQILQVHDGPCTMSQDSAFAGIPEGEATLNLARSFKNTDRKRKCPGSKDGPPIKKGTSSRKT
ncbi:hypothetical protein NDU88_009656, partial [Pleurodeles waltl]